MKLENESYIGERDQTSRVLPFIIHFVPTVLPVVLKERQVIGAELELRKQMQYQP